MTDTLAPVDGFQHRPHLDGLRTIAVYLVVLFHAGADRFAGGFIGVDLFFVLSGYLVTQVLITSQSPSGSVSLRRFYARRARRLLPAAITVLLASAAIYTVVASPAEVRASADSFQAAFLYYANWHFISASTDYFAADIETNPVLHFWSLAIEEQFYIVWPVLLVGLLSLRRRVLHGDAVARGVVMAAVALSAWWSFHLAHTDLSRAYYGTDARAYQLLAGALLALSPGLMAAGRPRRDRAGPALGAIGVAGLVLLGTSALDVGPVSRGLLATAAAVAALVGLEWSSAGSRLRRGLSLGPITYLGTISYGTYLWHWIVIIAVEATVEISPAALAAVTIVVATSLASLSHRLLEAPIRLSPALNRVPRLVALTGVGASVLLGLFVVPPLLEGDTGTGGSSVVAAEPGDEPTVGGLLAADVDWRAAAEDNADAAYCSTGPVSDCEVIGGSGPRILVLGDSHAIMLGPTFEEIAERRDLSLSVAAQFGCSWHLGLAPERYTPNQRARCFGAQHDWYDRVIDEVDPDLIVLAQRAPDSAGRVIAMVAEDPELAGVEQGELLEVTAERARDELRRLGRPTVIVEFTPLTTPEQDPLRCLSEATLVDECRYVAPVEPTGLEQLYRTWGGSNLQTVDIDRAVCPYLPICDPVIDGVVVKWDDAHLTTAYARAMSEQVEAALDDTGLLP